LFDPKVFANFQVALDLSKDLSSPAPPLGKKKYILLIKVVDSYFCGKI